MVPLKGETDTKVSLEIQVTEILHQIGVPAHIKGYHYLRDSIIMAIETPDIINAVTKQLYPSVAKKTFPCSKISLISASSDTT